MNAIDYSHQTIIVTGASSGIGTAFARELARRGADVILVARRLDRLEKLAAELQMSYHVQATPIALDLSDPQAGRALAQDLRQRGITITGLVNNAGFGTDGPFHKENPDTLVDEINVDVANLVDMTRAFIASLRSADTGILVNIASMAAYSPTPGMAVYAACKAFVLNFTEALWFESRGTGLRVLSLSPGLTRTEFFDDLKGGTYKGNYQTPEQVVHIGLRALDRGRGPSVQAGSVNKLATKFPRLLTRKRTVKISGAFSSRAAATTVDEVAATTP